MLRQSTAARQEAASKQEEVQRLANELSAKSYQAERLRTMLDAAGVDAEGDDMNASLVDLMRHGSSLGGAAPGAAAAAVSHHRHRILDSSLHNVQQHGGSGGELDVELADESMVAGSLLFTSSSPAAARPPPQAQAQAQAQAAVAAGGGRSTRARASMTAARASLLPPPAAAAAGAVVAKAPRVPLGARAVAPQAGVGGGL